MPRYLVKARLKPGRKAELAARLKDGTLAEGLPYQERLLAALREGHASGDDMYFMLETRDDSLKSERLTLEHFADVVNVVHVNEVSDAEFTRMDAEDPIPEWAGVDRDDDDD